MGQEGPPTTTKEEGARHMHDEGNDGLAREDVTSPVMTAPRTLRTLSLVTVTFFCTAGGPYGTPPFLSQL